MSATTKDAWADRYDQAAELLLGELVVAAAQFLRPRGWRQFGRAVTGRPASVLARTTGRTRPVRLPEAYLVAVTADSLYVLQARTEIGCGPVPRAIRVLAAWDRSGMEVATAADGLATQLTLVPAGGASVELHGPPGELTARVVRALGGEPVEQLIAAAAPVEPASPAEPAWAVAVAAPVEPASSASPAQAGAAASAAPEPASSASPAQAGAAASVAAAPASVAAEPQPATAG